MAAPTDPSAVPAVPAAPTDAERARTILAAAGSLTLTTDGHQNDRVVLHVVDTASRLLLINPPDGRLTAELAVAPGSGLASFAEFTDVAPVAVRDRVRARLALSGRLTLACPDTLLFRPARAALTEGDEVRAIDVACLAAAPPDPLAVQEAELLSHLDAAHGETVARLARLVPARLLLDVVGIRPVRIDSKGLVLRLERLRTHHDVRVPFASAATSPEDVGRRIHELLALSTSRPRGLS
ncbi:DUF2470 domain-containing protein [Streptomyces monticola]|uniref:DUF2470 domain-containing protein n=1 Tax=Streptomyces monticola TaxID=2666263 RepID=A0ABW2JCW9_9ACTN